jgi:hypothetical protein
MDLPSGVGWYRCVRGNRQISPFRRPQIVSRLAVPVWVAEEADHQLDKVTVPEAERDMPEADQCRPAGPSPAGPRSKRQGHEGRPQFWLVGSPEPA